MRTTLTSLTLLTGLLLAAGCATTGHEHPGDGQGSEHPGETRSEHPGSGTSGREHAGSPL